MSRSRPLSAEMTMVKSVLSYKFDHFLLFIKYHMVVLKVILVNELSQGNAQNAGPNIV